MRKAIRSQGDDKQDAYSARTAIHFEGPGKTRQEFAADADINNIMEKFGLQDQRPIQWGSETDYDIDLLTALEAQRELSDAWTRLPAEITDRYHSWEEVGKAFNRGELSPKKDETPQPTPDPGPEKPTPEP